MKYAAVHTTPMMNKTPNINTIKLITPEIVIFMGLCVSILNAYNVLTQ